MSEVAASPPARPNVDPTWRAPSARIRWAMGAVALVGLVVTLYLTWVSFYLSWSAVGKQAVIGCGGGGVFDCAGVLQSRWSKWFDLPVVSAAAASLYAAMLVALVLVGRCRRPRRARAAWKLVQTLATVAGAAAFWFLALLFFVVEGLCVYCLLAHACALAVFVMAWASKPPPSQAVRPGAVALGLLAVLVLGQYMSHPGKTHAIEVPDVPDGKSLVIGRAGGSGSHAGGISSDGTPRRSRLVSVLDGKVEIDAYDQPVLGSPEAEHVLVELFDYTCPHCRKMHTYLTAALARYGDQLAVVMLPVPLNADCNEHITLTPYAHRDACAVARLALAVWQTDRGRFYEFDAWLFESYRNRRPSQARRRAENLIGAKTLNEKLRGTAVDKSLQQNVKLYGLCQAGELPKLLFSRKVFRGEVISAEELFDILEQELNVKPVGG